MDILTVRLNTATTALREFVRGLNAFQPVEGITVLAILAALIVPGCNKVEAQGNSTRGENAPAQDNGDPSTDETKIGVTTIDVNQRALPSRS